MDRGLRALSSGCGAAVREPVERLCALDGSLLLFRAYHAVPALTGARGKPVNAAFGFAKTLLKIHRVLPSTFGLVAFDRFMADPPAAQGAEQQRGRAPRRALFAGYKDRRKPLPEDLLAQLELTKSLCREAGLACIASPAGSEADDVIASCVMKARSAGIPSLIVTSDKDLLQLVADAAPAVHWVAPGRMDEPWGERQTCEAFGLAQPSQLADLLALAGDVCDGVPGLPGIGPKIAIRLLETYGDLEAILAAAAAGSTTIKGIGARRLAALRDHAEAARLYRKVVTLRSDLPMPSLDELRWRPPIELRQRLARCGGFPSLHGPQQRAGAQDVEGNV